MAADSRFLIRSFPPLIRLSLTLLLLTLLGGLAASGRYLVGHYSNRDGVSGLTMDDFRGAYHGVDKRAPMLTVLEEGHDDPSIDAGLDASERDSLLQWLRGDRISQTYDDFDLGENAPAEIIARNCLDCHARQATNGDGIGQTIPLEYWDDIQAVAYSKSVAPTDLEIVYASLHTHSLSLAVIGIVVVGLAAGSRAPRWMIGLLAALLGFGLFADLGSWLLARNNVSFVWLIIAGGLMFTVACALLIVIEIIDLWWPMRRAPRRAD